MQLTPYGKVGNLELQWIILIYILEQKFCTTITAIMMSMKLRIGIPIWLQVPKQITYAFQSAHDLFHIHKFDHFRVQGIDLDAWNRLSHLMLNNQKKSIHIHDMIQKEQTLAQHLALRSGRMNSRIWKKKNLTTSYQLLRPKHPKDHKNLKKQSVSCNL
jgi:hypothetical protein